MGKVAVIRWGFAGIGAVAVAMATVPYEAARSNLASYFEAAGLDHLASYIPQSADTVGVLAGASMIVIALFGIPFAMRRPAQTELRSLLTGRKWTFHYNVQKYAHKTLGFNPDGSIAEGCNKNEHRWDVVNGYLEIRRANGDLQNRFAYDEETGRFIYVKSAGAEGYDGQYIARI